MKYIPILLLVIVCSKLSGQELDPLGKGNLLIGGTFSGYYEHKLNLEFEHRYSLDFHSDFGYFFVKKFATGISVSSSMVNTRPDHNHDWEKNYFIEFSPMLRYYFWKRMFISFTPGYVIGHFNSTRIDSKTRGFSLNQ
jgi:hypothetical protein